MAEYLDVYARLLGRQISSLCSPVASKFTSVYYSHSLQVLSYQYYSTEYKYTIWPTMWTQQNTNRIFGTGLLMTGFPQFHFHKGNNTASQQSTTLFRMACVKSRKPFSTLMLDFALVSRNGIPCWLATWHWQQCIITNNIIIQLSVSHYILFDWILANCHLWFYFLVTTTIIMMPTPNTDLFTLLPCNLTFVRHITFVTKNHLFHIFIGMLHINQTDQTKVTSIKLGHQLPSILILLWAKNRTVHQSISSARSTLVTVCNCNSGRTLTLTIHHHHRHHQRHRQRHHHQFCIDLLTDNTQLNALSEVTWLPRYLRSALLHIHSHT